MTTKFRVLGAGVWGLAFSDYLLSLGHTVEIFRRDTSLEADSIQQLGLKNVTPNHVKSLDDLNNQNPDNTTNIIAVNSKGFSDLLNNYESFKDWQHLYNKDTMIYILSDNRIIYASLTSS